MKTSLRSRRAIFVCVCGLFVVSAFGAGESASGKAGDSCNPRTKLPSALLCIEERVVDCRNSINPQELLYCAASELQKTDNELNRLYQKVLKEFDMPSNEYADYKKARKALIEGQRAWVTFKKSDCAIPGYLNLRGSIQSNEIVSCEIKHTKSRIADLNALHAP